MRYDDAKKWLVKIGGEVTEAKEQAPRRQRRQRGSIIVSVKSAKGQFVQRHCSFDDTLQGFEREIEIRRAFVLACMELKAALA